MMNTRGIAFAFVVPFVLACVVSQPVLANEARSGVGFGANNVASSVIRNSESFGVNNTAGNFGVNNGGAVEDSHLGEPKENKLSSGIALYRCRQFANAANDLGAALPSEFNNPLLHYYYANCMVHLRHKESAIREYRIAYALQPTGTIGDYCRLCLDRFGIDAEGKKAVQLKTTPAKHGLKNAAPEIPEPPTAAELAALKANPKDGSESALAREKSVENLRDLIQQKKRPNGAPLPNVVGTNLYVRSYKPEAPKQAPQAVPQNKPSFPLKGFKLWWW
ncbi:MAG TPA: hypothetical protein EYN91_13165 [Candidatus Melainabacteria bacterium]|jgi:hypothetical protein|nr:hypothetical protein [Candidatus Melainabacteria bacterium]HIN64940.1 hypothetical protein [Candidatus Obscuribacterales bacterium]